MNGFEPRSTAMKKKRLLACLEGCCSCSPVFDELDRKKEAWYVFTAAIELMKERIPKVEPELRADLETTVRMLSQLAGALEKSITEATLIPQADVIAILRQLGESYRLLETSLIADFTEPH